MPIDVSAQDFNDKVLNSDRPVLVDFWAPWCGPCKMGAPILDELAEELGDRLTIAKVNVDHNQELAAQYGLRGVPTLMLFNGGELVSQQVGVLNKAQLRDWVEQHASEGQSG